MNKLHFGLFIVCFALSFIHLLDQDTKKNSFSEDPELTGSEDSEGDTEMDEITQNEVADVSGHCGVEFSGNYGDYVTPTADSSGYECRVCGKALLDRSNCRRHVKLKHFNQTQVEVKMESVGVAEQPGGVA